MARDRSGAGSVGGHTMRKGLALAALTVLVAASADPAGARTSRLPAFASCASLVRYAQAHATRPAPLPAGRGTPDASEGQPVAAAPAAAEVPDDVSQTNVQEAGVDEPDLVKTDGRGCTPSPAGRCTSVDARADGRPAGSLELEPAGGHRLLLSAADGCSSSRRASARCVVPARRTVAPRARDRAARRRADAAS